ncbi:PA5502 family lipoprotein [Pseudomonas sp. Marseille-Q8238]
MNASLLRYVAAPLLGLLLSEAHAEFWSVDDQVKAFNTVSSQIARGELQAAESGLTTLQQSIPPSDVRIEQYQRELASAYLRQGQQRLAAHDTPGASQALNKAQRYMAKAPGLRGEYEQALAALKASSPPTPDPATIARQKAEQAQQQKAAEEKLIAERARQQAAREAAAKRTAQEAAKAEAAAAARAPRLIDPTAASSDVPLPMLDTQDRESLRTLLDAVAADVVNFNCAVHIEVREAKDYPFVAALLSARIKKLNPGHTPQLSHVTNPDAVPHLVLTPGQGE